ncbi:hypothetical protein GCM10010918_46610 [Paenibacillus radicis (ex Gao et al. 2016)]|uniref:Uncharacterized protein n=1 Tax=Paenibacillus radicis (ex Gao et al. 2016) TaxID=1737354 RepID=A0A917M788_9BACL|nr:hypothetical protein GCM10010918_46610 [Paenibacillus radicis (ex Gao et al. 2016)]
MTLKWKFVIDKRKSKVFHEVTQMSGFILLPMKGVIIKAIDKSQMMLDICYLLICTEDSC